MLIGGYIATGLVAGILVLNETSRDQSREYRMLERGFILGIGGMILSLTLKEQLSTSPTDKLIELWHKDPRRVQVDVSAAPVPGGGVVGMTGRF